VRASLERPAVLLIVLAASAALFLAPLAANPASFPFSPGSEYSDALTAHLSSALFLRRAVATWGQIPLWNPTILGGLPFGADPLSGLWYPPLWLLAAWPAAPVLNLVLWAHLVLAGTGMTLLLRDEGLAPSASLVGGLAFAGMPKMIGHVGLGHVTLVAAVSWTPWALLAARRAIQGAEGFRWLRRFLVCGAVCGLVFLVDPRWFLPSTALTVAYGGWSWLTDRGAARANGRRLALGTVAALIGLVAATATVAIPFLEFVGASTRAALGAPAGDPYALPAARLVGLLVTTRGEWAEWLVSPGSVVFVAAIVGLVVIRRRGLYWPVVFVAAVVLALGRVTLFGDLLTRLPGFDQARVPARWLFASGMALAALAARGVDAVVGPAEARRPRLAAVFAAALAAAANTAVGAAGDGRLGGAVPAASAVAVGIVLVLSLARAGRRTFAILPLILVAELLWIDASLIDPRAAADARARGRAVASALGTLEAGERVFSPSYSLPQEAAAEAGLHLADGVHPLQLRAYVDFMAEATGFDRSEYSVTLPPFPTGDPAADWNPRLDEDALGLLAVRRIVSAFPLEAHLTPEAVLDGTFVYRNDRARPRAWVEPAGPQPATPWRDVLTLDWTPNRVIVRATGPGRLILADPVYPGWRATVDGRPTLIEPYQDLLRSVVLPEGEHVVVFRFAPISLTVGLLVALAAAGLAAALWRRP